MPPPREALTRAWHTVRHGPILRNIAGALALQLALVVSGTFSARILGPTNRGYLALLLTVSSTIGQIGAVGLSLGATYYLASGRVGGREVMRLLRRPAAIQVVTLTAAFAITMYVYVSLTHAPIVFPAIVSVLIMPGAIAQDYGIALALGGRHHGVASGARAISSILYAAGLTYLFVRGGGTLDSVVVIAVASLVIAGAVALALGVRVARGITPTESLVAAVGRKAARSEILSFGRRGYIGYLSPTDTFRIDQLLIAFVLSPHELGLYAVAAAFTNFTRMVAVNVGMSSTSEVAGHSDAHQRRAAVRHTLGVSAGLITVVTAGLCLVVPFITPLLFGSAFADSVPIAECLLIAAWFLSMKRIAVDLMRGAGELRLGTRAELINLAVFIILCVPAAVLLGGVGVAACLALSAACGSVYLVRGMRGLGFV